MRSIWSTRRAILLHVVTLLFVPACLGLGWWQLHRALSGNRLSWAYTFEWPFFALYAVFMWWRLIHDQDEGEEGATDAEAAPAARSWRHAQGPEPQVDEQMAAYNDYLASLAEGDPRKHA